MYTLRMTDIGARKLFCVILYGKDHLVLKAGMAKTSEPCYKHRHHLLRSLHRSEPP